MIALEPQIHDEGLQPRPALYPATRLDGLGIADSEPRVAVVMRTRNRPLLLHRALSSVALQTYPHWHLYVVNDGGDRAEFESVFKTYQGVFSARSSVIHRETNHGMERASNAALAAMRDEQLVAIHDDDDSWHPDFLMEIAAWYTSPASKGFVAVITGCILVKEKIVEGRVIEIKRERWPYASDIIDFRQILVANQFPPISCVFRREAIRRIGGFNGELSVLGDWEFNLRLMLLGDIGFIDRQLAHYHHRIAGTSGEYGNTVVDSNKQHLLQNIRLRNGALRASLADRPEMLGVVQTQLCATDQVIQMLVEITKGMDRGLVMATWQKICLIGAVVFGVIDFSLLVVWRMGF